MPSRSVMKASARSSVSLGRKFDAFENELHDLGQALRDLVAEFVAVGVDDEV